MKEEINIKNYEWIEENLINFEIEDTNELIKIADNIRRKKGNKDLVKKINNDVWYNFYLDVDLKKKKIRIWFSANNSIKDDYASYEIKLTKETQNKLLWKAFQKYIEEKE